MNDCIFCSIVAGSLPSERVYEDDQFLAFLDIHPVHLGHTLLIPKRHHENLLVLPDELLAAMLPLAKRLALRVKEATGADGINLGMNNERAAGQIVPHAHLHIIPRFADDGLVHWPDTKVASDALAAFAARLRS